jgi:hypothetical protein
MAPGFKSLRLVPCGYHRATLLPTTGIRNIKIIRVGGKAVGFVEKIGIIYPKIKYTCVCALHKL